MLDNFSKEKLLNIDLIYLMSVYFLITDMFGNGVPVRYGMVGIPVR